MNRIIFKMDNQNSQTLNNLFRRKHKTIIVNNKIKVSKEVHTQNNLV